MLYWLVNSFQTIFAREFQFSVSVSFQHHTFKYSNETVNGLVK